MCIRERDYVSIYLIGTIFVQLALGLNTFISAQGFATTAMLSVLIGAVTNIVLDPVFIFVLGLGCLLYTSTSLSGAGVTRVPIFLCLYYSGACEKNQ